MLEFKKNFHSYILIFNFRYFYQILRESLAFKWEGLNEVHIPPRMSMFSTVVNFDFLLLLFLIIYYSWFKILYGRFLADWFRNIVEM